MEKIVLATSNPNKVLEINSIMKEIGYEFILPPKEFNPIEDGKIFEENALIKAHEASKLTSLPAIADDSGLCVDALNGAPGIFSARYANSQKEKIDKLLFELKNVPDSKRNAHFICALAFISAEGKVLFLNEGKCFGKIGFEPKGANGFGYDPIFIVDGKNLTMSELSEKEKNIISH